MIVVFNCGSSSIKFALFKDVSNKKALFSGLVESIGSDAPLYSDSKGNKRSLNLAKDQQYRLALEEVNRVLEQESAGHQIVAYAHRVVHGGNLYTTAIKIDDEVLTNLKSFIPLAPLHQPYAVQAIEILQNINNDMTHVACFDTAFHSTITRLEHLLPIPYELYEKGIRRYGFHGLSYAYIAHILQEKYGEQAGAKVIAAHLGSGASLCALQDSKSVATTMGFSALEGLMMGTRTGAVDPGVLLYLLEVENLSTKELSDMLYKKSGLLGVSGLSNDVRVLLGAESEGNERAKLALNFYIKRVVKEIGSLVASLNGLDTLVFTAGIGERSAVMRLRICQQLSFLGLQIDEEANHNNAAIISTKDSQIKVLVEPTNEEWIAAKSASELLH